MSDNLIYKIDSFDMNKISGWAYYLENEDPVELEIILNDRSVGSFKANNFCEDLIDIRSDANFAFDITVFCPEGPLKDFVPKSSKVFLREKKNGIVLEDSRCIWDGLADKNQLGIINSYGLELRLLKGIFIVPISSREVSWKHRMLNSVKKLILIASNGGFELSTSYGTLLGGVRTGSLIGHDDDIDLMFISSNNEMLDAANDFGNLSSYLSAQGFSVEILTSGQMHVQSDDMECPVDIFLAWFDNNKLSLTFTIKEGPEYNEIMPLTLLNIEGIDLPSPNIPEKLLEKIYGKNWKNPDPSFSWTLPADVAHYFLPLHNHEINANNDYWQKYYSVKSDLSPPDKPSQFALFVMQLNRNPSLIIDLGCGTGRDAEYFAQQGINCIGLDYSTKVIH